jgi:hypothetical protein
MLSDAAFYEKTTATPAPTKAKIVTTPIGQQQQKRLDCRRCIQVIVRQYTVKKVRDMRTARVAIIAWLGSSSSSDAVSASAFDRVEGRVYAGGGVNGREGPFGDALP